MKKFYNDTDRFEGWKSGLKPTPDFGSSVSGSVSVVSKGVSAGKSKEFVVNKGVLYARYIKFDIQCETSV